MKKPIFRIFASYEITNKIGVTRRPIKGVIDTFALSDEVEEIKKDQDIINRICYINKRKPEKVNIEIKKVDIENQYGFTTDRF